MLSVIMLIVTIKSTMLSVVLLNAVEPLQTSFDYYLTKGALLRKL